MDSEEYFRTITLELKALKDRVRNFVHHWQTDGEWKESVLRSILRRHLPSTVGVGRGFIITNEGASTQIDLLIYDTSKPVLYRDGDLVFITPDAACGVIEVKTKLTTNGFKKTLEKLSDNAEFINKNSSNAFNHTERFFALFSYESELDNKIEYVFDKLQDAVNCEYERLIHYLCLGNSTFIRYWDLDPENGQHELDAWRSYNLRDKAPAYFINNIIDHVCPESVSKNPNLWFPKSGKEQNRTGERSVKKS